METKKFLVINDGVVVYGPTSKARAKLESEVMRDNAINEKLEEWVCATDECSEKRRMEVAIRDTLKIKLKAA